MADGRFRFSLIPRRSAFRSIASTEVRNIAAASSNVAEAAAISISWRSSFKLKRPFRRFSAIYFGAFAFSPSSTRRRMASERLAPWDFAQSMICFIKASAIRTP